MARATAKAGKLRGSERKLLEGWNGVQGVVADGPDVSDELIIYADEDPVLAGLMTKLVPVLVVDGLSGDASKLCKQEAFPPVFRRWCEEAMRLQRRPSNPRLILRRAGTEVVDMEMVLVVRQRTSVLTLPSKLPPGQTAEDYLLQKLTDEPIAMDAQRATEFIRNEVVVKQERFIPDLAPLLLSEDPTLKAAARKVMTLVLGDESEPLTADERAKLLLMRTTASVKEGCLNRCIGYCDSAEQLGELLRSFLNVDLSAPNPRFAEGTPNTERDARLVTAIRDHILKSPAEKAGR